MSRMRVAFIVQRCGREVTGGAEALCLQIAQRMVTHWEVKILATCALDYMTWDNHYPVGEEDVGGVLIRRFPVDQRRDVEQFNQLSAQLQGQRSTASKEQQETWMRAQGPISSGLLDHLAAGKDDYDAFIFFGYLYATTYFGLPIVKEKSWLAPLGHDEWTIHFRMWDAFFMLPRGFVFQTPEEKKFLQKRFPTAALNGPTAGIGVAAPPRVHPEEFRKKYNLRDPFLLYVGRIDASKGCAEMFEWFVRFRRTASTTHKLVLIGSEVLPVPFHDDIIYLGFVKEAEKWNAMAACDWLLMPSPYESLSIVLLETWAVGRPAIVNAKAEVLKGHCARSHGGLWYETFEECDTYLTHTDEKTKRQLAEQGRRYVATNYTWERVEQDYAHALNPAAATQPG